MPKQTSRHWIVSLMLYNLSINYFFNKYKYFIVNGDVMKLSVLGYELDKEQTKAACMSKCNTIIIAGAGTGKSTTMVGKIKYLVLYEHVSLEDILCITFTNNAANSLEEKIKQELNQETKVYTFHKLSLEILKDHSINYHIVSEDLLSYLVDEIFYSVPSIYFEQLFLDKNYLEKEEFRQYKTIIIRFIKLFIANYYDIQYFEKILKKAKKRDLPILKIIKKIYEMYLLEKKATGTIDFDDMIYMATKLVNQKGIDTHYQYIIVDEYQDTSQIREQLVQAIQNKTGAYVTVVGDDFQSIYRFSGCDINNFLEFEKNFKPAKELYITNTYRNSKELISVAGSFIMKNPRQMKKKLKSNKSISKPIVVCYYKNVKDDFYKLLASIPYPQIMVLGRNNYDIFSVLNNKLKIENNQIYFPNKNVYYKTIHKAKGLEEEQVIIINLTNDIHSLPSKVKDEKILKYVIKHFDIYPFEEERRLFYVALTRTKNRCYLFVSQNNPSIFVKELIKNYKEYISFIHL